MFAKLVIAASVLAVVVAMAAHRSAGAGPERVYVVRPGDTLWSIAASRYAGDPREGVWRLQRRNDLAGTVIRPGERLYIPR